MRYPQLVSTEGWDLFVTEEHKKIYFRKEPGFKVVTQYLESVINAPYKNVIALLMEVDLFKEWIPMLSEAKIRHQHRPFRQYLYQKFNAPWPMKGREVHVEVTGYMLPFENAFVYTFNSINEDEWFGFPVQKSKGFTELVFNKALGYIKPIGPNQTLFKFILNSDP